jgi:hypothetical protein
MRRHGGGRESARVRALRLPGAEDGAPSSAGVHLASEPPRQALRLPGADGHMGRRGRAGARVSGGAVLESPRAARQAEDQAALATAAAIVFKLGHKSRFGRARKSGPEVIAASWIHLLRAPTGSQRVGALIP